MTIRVLLTPFVLLLLIGVTMRYAVPPSYNDAVAAQVFANLCTPTNELTARSAVNFTLSRGEHVVVRRGPWESMKDEDREPITTWIGLCISKQDVELYVEAAPPVPAVPAVAAVEAVAEVKKRGKVVMPAVKAVEAVEAVEAVPAKDEELVGEFIYAKRFPFALGYRDRLMLMTALAVMVLVGAYVVEIFTRVLATPPTGKKLR